MVSASVSEDAALAFCSLVDPHDRRAYYCLLICILALLVAPLWVVEYNTLVDYPSHLARAYVLNSYAQVPFFQQLFLLVLEPLPNTACDLLLPVLLNWCPPLVAGKLFLSAIVLLFGWGCHLLAAGIHGRPSWTAPLCALLAYHSNFLYGFVNYAFGLGLFLIGLALWMRFRSGWTVTRCLLVGSLAVAAYLAHLSAFVFLGMGAAWLFLWDCLRKRRIVWRDALPLLILSPSVLLYLYPWTNRVRFQHPVWPTVPEKVFGLGALFIGYDYGTDALLLLALLSVAGLVWWRGGADWNRPLLWFAAALMFMYLIVPKHLSGGRFGSVDSRFVAPAILLALLAMAIALPRPWARAAFLTVLACALLRWGATAVEWRSLSAKAVAMVSLLDQVRPESRIYVLIPTPAGRREAKQSRANLHVTSYAVVRRHSVPGNFFAAQGVEPLIHRQPEQWVDEESPARIDPNVLTPRLRYFDYLWGCNLNSDARLYLSPRAALLGQVASCGLWDLRRP